MKGGIAFSVSFVAREHDFPAPLVNWLTRDRHAVRAQAEEPPDAEDGVGEWTCQARR